MAIRGDHRDGPGLDHHKSATQRVLGIFGADRKDCPGNQPGEDTRRDLDSGGLRLGYRREILLREPCNAKSAGYTRDGDPVRVTTFEFDLLVGQSANNFVEPFGRKRQLRRESIVQSPSWLTFRRKFLPGNICLIFRSQEFPAMPRRLVLISTHFVW